MARWQAMSLCALATLLGSASAKAHEWYPLNCCSEKDCRALIEANGEIVSETAEGWRLWDGRLVKRGMAKLSPDGKFHLCETRSRSILCFFVPPGSS
jgi:hypothetical protein